MAEAEVVVEEATIGMTDQWATMTEVDVDSNALTVRLSRSN